ncbi:aldose 1-epimerase family protein [Enterococcus sp. LJL98]
MKITIETAYLQATIDSKGAELQSLFSKEHEIEYLWQGDPQHWGRRSPVLFPIVGALKDDQYTYQGKVYPMSQHGFARDMEFEVFEQASDAVTFVLKSNEETRNVYPFDFQLFLSYQLGGDGLTVAYKVQNESKETMYFSIGGHPAFNVPLVDHLTFEDYYLKSSPMKSRITIPLKGRFIDLEHRTLGQTNAAIAFTRELFAHDALIFETKGLNSFSICSDRSPHKVTLSYNHLPFVGIWSPAATEAPFVCIEPWAGIADTTDATGDLTEKYGIETLASKETFFAKYAITVK